MKIQYLAAALLLSSSVSAHGAIGGLRNSAVGELAAYCAPQSSTNHPSLVFMPDGQSYLVRSDDGRSLIVKDIATGKDINTLFDVTHTRETTLPDFEGFILSPDASKIMVWRNSESIYRRSSTAEYYVYEVRSRLLKPL